MESWVVYVTMDGTHSDLSSVMVVALFSVSFRAMFFAHVISCPKKCRL